MKKTICTILLCCFFFASRSQFDNKLADFGLKGNVSSLVEKEYQLTNYDYNSKKEERKATFVFNKSGLKTEETYAAPSGEVLYRGVFTYSSSGELAEEKVNNFEYNRNFVKKYIGTPTDITVNIEFESETPRVHEKYTLNSKKQVTQRVDYDNGEPFRTLKYSYNSSGMLQSETQQMPGATINFKYTYNNRGLPETKTEVNAAGKILHTQSYTYNTNGNVVTETTSYSGDPQKLTLSYKYVLDSVGNWTEKQEYMDGHLFSVTTREISYF
ncbi:MAG: hypothetical protein LBQ70_06885 [Prevotellaceae bacterium]|jgi:hypothetical protein|nr:hypothetical protein [Prevotellaceae bacterium]